MCVCVVVVWGRGLWHYRLWSFKSRDTRLEEFFCHTVDRKNHKKNEMCSTIIRDFKCVKNVLHVTFCHVALLLFSLFYKLNQNYVTFYFQRYTYNFWIFPAPTGSSYKNKERLYLSLPRYSYFTRMMNSVTSQDVSLKWRF